MGAQRGLSGDPSRSARRGHERRRCCQAKAAAVYAPPVARDEEPEGTVRPMAAITKRAATPLTKGVIGPVVCVALTVASFAYFNSGARGVAACERDGFTGPGTLSWWQPGSVCEGGEPQFRVVELNAAFLVVPALLLAFAAAAWAVKAIRDPAPI